MTIFILFHQLGFRHFKGFYLQYVKAHRVSYFPKLVSYTRFVTLLKSVLIPLCALMQSFSGQKTGIYFVDSIIIKACHIKRKKQHRVFKGLATQSKSLLASFLALNCT